MAIKAMTEMVGTKYWDFMPAEFRYYKQMIDSAILLRTQFEKVESGVPFLLSSADAFHEKVYVGNAPYISRELELEEGDVIVNMIPVEGPIIRNGDACSYGSRNYRDWIMKAADIPACKGHVFYIDTPGGSAYAKNDFKFAVDYARSKGQPVIALVDGLCASAGMALASMCDEIYFVNPNDRIGCIGTMCAFYATPDGVVDAVTNERYVEVYGSKSEWKNKEYRDAAKGDYEELQKQVDELNEEFLDIIRTYRPQVLEEQMHGKIYNCGEVIGTLTDGQGTMQSCIDRVLELAGVQSGETASQEPAPSAAPEDDKENALHAEDDTQGVSTDVMAQETENEINNSEEGTTEEPVVPSSSEEVPASQNEERKMKQYPKLMAALGLAEMGVDKENGVYLHEALCDAMESFLGEAEVIKNTRDAKIQESTALNARIEELKNEHEQAMNGLKEAQAQEIENLKQAHQAEMDEKQNAHEAALQSLAEQKDTEMGELRKQIDEANASLENLKNEVSEKEAEIQEVSEAAAPAPAPTAPVADGVQVQAPSVFENKSVISSGMSNEQKKEALRNRKKELEMLIG